MLITLPNAFGDAATNMAIDAALLQSIPEGLAAFRHYGWLEPAVTFGYAQNFSEVQQTTEGEPTLCRRLTGGGIVDHRNDWTYAIIIHSSLPSASMPATKLYEKIHQAIASTLKTLQVETHLAPCPKDCISENPASRISQPISKCFVTPAANDVLRTDGQKIAGAAMKRSRTGLLIQGSLDRSALPDDFDYAMLQSGLVEHISQALDLPTGELEDVRPLFNSDRIGQEKERYSSEDWNKKR